MAACFGYCANHSAFAPECRFGLIIGPGQVPLRHWPVCRPQRCCGVGLQRSAWDSG
jgi:hypothetical protein